MSMDHIEEAFFYLWNHGKRVIAEEEKDSQEHGAYQERNGMVSGFTINGIKQLAEKQKLMLDGIPITPEEVEFMFNYGRFRRVFK